MSSARWSSGRYFPNQRDRCRDPTNGLAGGRSRRAPRARRHGRPPLTAAKPHPAVEGGIERADPDGTVAGFCWSPAEPDAKRTVIVTVDGHLAARVLCDRKRQGQGAHGFALRLPAALRKDGGTGIVALRDAANGREVGTAVRVTWGKPLGKPPASSQERLSGHVDRVSRDGWVAGWCWDPARPGHRVRLEVLADGEVAGTMVAGGFRADLVAAGIGDGAHAFSFALPYDVLARKTTVTVGVREAETGRPLGQPATVRMGRLADSDQRVRELERQVRLLQGKIGELERQAEQQPQADERAARMLFATVAGFFRELADGVPPDARGFGMGGGLRVTLDALSAGLPLLTMRRAHAPSVTLVVPAIASIEAVHRCLVALHDAHADAVADIVVIDPGTADQRCALLPSLVRNIRYLRGPSVAALDDVAGAAETTYLALVAPEVDADGTWLRESLATLRREERAALVGAPVVRADGLLQHAYLAVAPGGALSDPGQFADAGEAAYRFLRPVHAMSALAFVAVRESVLRVGGFGVGYESLAHATADLCLRLRAAGFGVMAQPAAAVRWADAPDIDPFRTTPATTGQDEDARRLRLALLSADADALADPFVAHALVTDDAVPQPDRDAGSVVALEHMLVLRRLGWRVTFATAREAEMELAVRRGLERLGIEVAAGQGATQVLQESGDRFDLVHVYRFANARLLAPRVREMMSNAKLLFSPADLHFLRTEREAKLAGRRSDKAMRQAREQEIACVREADATIVYSDHEHALLAKAADAERVHLLRWITRPEPSGAGFEGRGGMLFVGNFAHPPNADAAIWFVDSVMPLLRRLRPGLMLHVVGATPPASVEALAALDVVVHGWVADLATLLGRVRLSVAPLRYGAGFKGKVATSLAHGVPLVGTGIALEGTGLRDGDGVVLADAPEAIAAAIMRLHDDAAAWEAMSHKAVERVAALYAPEAADVVYRRMLGGLGLPFRRAELSPQ